MKLRFSHVAAGLHPVRGQLFLQRVDALGHNAQRYQRYLANTLSGLAPDISECDRLLHSLDCVESGMNERVEWEGRDVTLDISKNAVQVNIEVNEDWVGSSEGLFTLDELRRAVLGWKEFLALPEAEDAQVEATLSSRSD